MTVNISVYLNENLIKLIIIDYEEKFGYQIKKKPKKDAQEKNNFYFIAFSSIWVCNHCISFVCIHTLPSIQEVEKNRDK